MCGLWVLRIDGSAFCCGAEFVVSGITPGAAGCSGEVTGGVRVVQGGPGPCTGRDTQADQRSTRSQGMYVVVHSDAVNYLRYNWRFVQRDELGALVSLEMGKIKTEGVGEVQEFVDIVRALTFAAVAYKILKLTLGRLCGGSVKNDEWQSHSVRTTGT